MLRITISKSGAPPRSSTFDKREITVGRTASNDLVIPEPGVSSNHARILNIDGELTLIDLESTNGTFVNGQRIQGPCVIGASDEVFICAHKLQFDLANGASASAPAPMGASEPAPAPPGPPPPAPSHAADTPPPPMEPQTPAPPPAAPSDALPPMMGGNLQVPSPIGGLGPSHAKRPGEPPTLPPMMGGPPDLPDDAPPPAQAPPVDAKGPDGGPAGWAQPSVGPSPPSMAPPPPLETPPDPSAPEPAVRTGGTLSPPGAGAAPPSLPPPLSQPPPLEPAQAPPDEPPRAQPSMAPAPPEPPPPEPSPEPPPPAPSPPEEPANQTPSEPPAPPAEPAPPPPPAAAQPEPAPQPEPQAWARPPEPPPPPPTPSAGTNPPGSGLARPAPVTPLQPSAPSAPEAPAGLGNLDELTHLQGSDRAREACARVFAAVFDELSLNGELWANDADARAQARSRAHERLTEVAKQVPDIEARPWAERIAGEMCGLGALSAHLADPEVREIFVHGPDRVVVRRGDDAAALSDAGFSCPQAIEVVVRRLTGTSFGVDNPVVDARTFDGADVYAVHESVAPGGPVVNITLPTDTDPRWSLEMLIGVGTISPVLANLLSTCVHAGLNIAICAGAGASAFPLLAALCEAAPSGERQVIVRPTRERGLLPPDAIVLEGDGLVGTDGATVMQALVRTALGLVPQRLLVHEVVGPEAAEVFAAMGRGLRGTVLGTRASTASQGLARLSSLAAMASPLTDTSARTRQVASSIELVLTVERFADGITRVTEVAEPTVASGVAQAVEIIRYDGNNRQWLHSGVVPNFFGDLQRRGYPVDAGMLGG